VVNWLVAFQGSGKEFTIDHAASQCFPVKIAKVNIPKNHTNLPFPFIPQKMKHLTLTSRAQPWKRQVGAAQLLRNLFRHGQVGIELHGFSNLDIR
jgi:hypothetical protein